MTPTLPILAAFLILQSTTPAPAPEPRYFHLSRTIQAPSGTQSCATLDAPIFVHSTPTLADIRLYTGPPASLSELPYVITTSQSTLLPPDPARVLNLGLHGSHIAFDLAMPPRPYTELTLDLAGHDFLASATLTGTQSPGRPKNTTSTTLGTFTLFDLTSQHLSRSTSIPLQESTYPFLHIELAVTPAPGSNFAATPAMVRGAAVPPNREAQTLYTPIIQTTQFTQRGHDSIATLALPAHVPVERISFSLSPADKTNFSRTVHITANPAHPAAPGRHLAAAPETLFGEISRVNLTEAGQMIDQQSLSIPATLGENTDADATVEIAVQNGDDHPIPLASVTLEMRQRSLCFQTPEAPAHTPAILTLFYGDATLAPPIYDFARLFNPAARTRPATLLAEQPNPLYTPRPTPQRSLTERHPELLWLALLGVIAVLAVVAFRSSKHIHPHP